QRDRRGELGGADEAARNLENLLMDRLKEMAGLEKVGDPIERFVVDQNGAQQGLLRLDVVRCGAIAGLRLFRKDAGRRLRHDCQYSQCVWRARDSGVEGVRLS